MIIDAHIHRGTSPNQYVFDTSLERLLDIMDLLGIATSINSPTRHINLGDLEGGNKEAVEEYRLSNGRIRSFFYYDPRISDESIAVMEKYSNESAFCAIKIHPAFCWVSADDESYRPVWEYAKKKRLPLLAHSWDISRINPKQVYSHTSRFEKYLREFPDVQFIFAHSGGRYHAIKHAADLGKKYSNAYFDIAGDIFENGFLEYLVSKVGSGRIMFGSDYSMMDQRTMLGVVLGADINPRDRENILYNTALKVYLGG